MDLKHFLKWKDSESVPDDIHPLLRALLLESAGNWDEAHTLAQNDPGKDGAWVHAYLHRVEGDLWNANYWYRNAGRRMPDISTDEEWQKIAGELVERLR